MRQLTATRDQAGRRARTGQGPPDAQAGVTLIELIVVMVIVVILMAIGVPSYRYVTTSNRMSTEVNSLLWDLQYARSESVREGEPVTVCVAASTGTACAASGTNTWQDGWIVFGDLNNDQTIDPGDPVLRVQNAFSSSDTFQSGTATSAITFNRYGFAYLGASGLTIALHDSTSDSVYTRCLELTQAGMMTTATYSPPSCT